MEFGARMVTIDNKQIKLQIWDTYVSSIAGAKSAVLHIVPVVSELVRNHFVQSLGHIIAAPLELCSCTTSPGVFG